MKSIHTMIRGAIIIAFFLALFTGEGWCGWELKYHTDKTPITTLCFFDSDHGCVGLDNGTILRTTDSGNTWLESEGGVVSHPDKMRFFSANTGFCLSREDPYFNLYMYSIGTLYCTVDGGKTWNRVAGLPDSVVSYSFWNETSGLVVCWDYVDWRMMKTTDGGGSWTVIREDDKPWFSAEVQDIYCVDDTTWWLIHDMRSLDSTPNKPYYIERTIDGGDSWEIVYSTANPSSRTAFRISSASDNERVWLLGRMMWQLVDRSKGYAFFESNGNTLVEFWDRPFVYEIVSFGENDALFAFGEKTDNDQFIGYFAHTSDSGLTFDSEILLPVAIQENNEAMINFAAPSRNELWITTGKGFFYKYTDDNVTVSSEKQPQSSLLAINPPFPNPFNAKTTIEYVLLDKMRLKINIYNVLGQHIDTLINNDILDEGRHYVTFDATGLADGLYFVIFEGDKIMETSRILLLK